MKVSRDIHTLSLIQYAIDERFFKIPIENWLDMEGILPNQPQIAIINALNDPSYRFVTACVSRRVGKSYIAYNCAFIKALEPNTCILVVAPNYSLANIGWDHINRLIAQHGLGTDKSNSKDKEIVLKNGSLIKLASAAQPDSAVGRSYDLIIFEEAAIASEGGDAFDLQLMPTLDKPNSKALFISTPRGYNWFKVFYDRGYDEEFPEWISIHATYKDNPRAKLSTIEQARKSVSAAYFRQEYEADFTTFEGQVFEYFSMVDHVKNLSEMEFGPETFEAILGIDVGYRDPTAMLSIMYDMDSESFYILEEYQRSQVTTAVYAEHIQKLIDKYDIERIFVDSAAAQFRQDLAYEHDISTSPAKKSVLDGISSVQVLFEQNKIFIDESCTELIQCLLNYRWEIKDGSLLGKEKPVHDKYSHLMDALRYAVYSMKGT